MSHVRRLLKLLPLRRGAIVDLCLLVVFCAGVPVVIPWIIGRAFDRAVLATGSVETREEFLWIYVAAIFTAEVAVLVFLAMKDLRTHALSERLLLELRVKVYARLQHLSPRYHADRRVGGLASRVLDDTRELETLFQEGLSAVVLGPLAFVGVFAVLCVMNPALAAFALVPVPFLYAAIWLFVRGMRRTAPEIRGQEERLSARVHESLSGHAVVARHGREGYEADRFRGQGEGLMGWRMRRARLVARYYPVVGFLTGAGTAIVLAAGGKLAMAGSLSPGDLVAFLGYLAFFYVPVLQVTRANHILQNVAASSGRIFEVLDDPSVPGEPDDPEPLPERRSLEFDDVHFAHGAKPVLEGVTLEVAPGERVGLEGPTGAGKTTLAALTVRFHDPRQGAVRIGGVDARRLRLRDLRRTVGLVMQDEFLFCDTIRANLLYARPRAPDDEVREACRAAALLDFVEGLPGGLETVIGERGVRLSQGERQRLAIARALLARPDILVLDEATSALDEETEGRVLDGALERMSDGAVLVISHRPGPLRRCGRVVRLVGGKLSSLPALPEGRPRPS